MKSGFRSWAVMGLMAIGGCVYDVSAWSDPYCAKLFHSDKSNAGIVLWYDGTEFVERTTGSPEGVQRAFVMSPSIPVVPTWYAREMLAAQASAQATEDEKESKKKETDAAAEPADEVEPTLDELLGIEEEDGASGDDATSVDLDRKLSGQEIGEAFDQAVRLMGDAAERVGKNSDVSVATQRVQEDALKRLDQLIASIEQNQQQQQQQQSQNQKQQQQQQQPSQQQQQAGKERREGKASDSNEIDPPGLREGALGEGVESAKAAWGSLPARVRDMLVQGVSDRFSSTYRQMTEEYYKRLAEESGEK